MIRGCLGIKSEHPVINFIALIIAEKEKKWYFDEDTRQSKPIRQRR